MHSVVLLLLLLLGYVDGASCCTKFHRRDGSVGAASMNDIKYVEVGLIYFDNRRISYGKAESLLFFLLPPS